MYIKHLRICSDLHLEWRKPGRKTLERMIPPDERDKDSCLILAGDIHPNQVELLCALEVLSARFEAVFLVLGNHDFWLHNLSTYEAELKVRLPNGVHMQQLFFDSPSGPSRLLGTTLWATGAWRERIQGVPDFRNIHVGGTRFTPELMRKQHYLEKEKLAVELAADPNGCKFTAVVTHHLPCEDCVAPQYVGDPLNGIFVGDAKELIAPPVDLWINGHTHVASHKVINGVDVICNPRGYVNEEGTNYDPKLFYDL